MKTALRAVDFRLLYVLLLGLSGSILLFSFVISTSVVVASACTAVALAWGLFIAIRAMPPWRGSNRGKAVVVGFGVAQLAVVIGVVLAIK